MIRFSAFKNLLSHKLALLRSVSFQFWLAVTFLLHKSTSVACSLNCKTVKSLLIRKWVIYLPHNCQFDQHKHPCHNFYLRYSSRYINDSADPARKIFFPFLWIKAKTIKTHFNYLSCAGFSLTGFKNKLYGSFYCPMEQ